MGTILFKGEATFSCWSTSKRPSISDLVSQHVCPGCGIEHSHMRHTPDCWVRVGIAWFETSRARQAHPSTEPTIAAKTLASVIADGPAIVERAKAVLAGGPALDAEEVLTLAAYVIATERKPR